ncbi:Na+/K+ transporting ATPase subunit alpha [Reticulomyxa filosa]|uniref:Na+/K+ transporting ATPase subunit alpha n=1 Tax=Reticulomyxa filosa TaxID=46433 RepID=X6N4F2_RETFI|nr:Na+/K+ transporting ATPase subunit alpha [Reticulomyxa filosa]|eukprot:ETO20202.1 Na+/K+ transporting ATPase subunit alpha [Reticulomyxa filosa]
MADTENVAEMAVLTDKEEEIVPDTRYSSSDVIAAAEEIKFKQQQAAEKVEREIKTGKKTPEEAQAELRKAYTTMAHVLDKLELAKDLNEQAKKKLRFFFFSLPKKGPEKHFTNVEEKLQKFGFNELSPAYREPWYVKMIRFIFGGFFNQLLLTGAVLCFVAYGLQPTIPSNMYLGVCLIVVVLVTGLFGFYQESKSDDLMAGLSKMLPPNVIVLRNGEKTSISPTLLVPGDIVDMSMGMRIPADIRIFDCTPDMEVDNSSLTGESEPQKRDWRKSNLVPAESPNLTFFGTLLVRGKGTGVVIGTGDTTFMGHTAKAAASTESEPTPIALEIKDFCFKISIIAFALGILFFVLGMATNPNWIVNVVWLIGIIVANVPEGLLAEVTVSLTLTANRMFHKNVRVKNLESVETLGSTTVICSDKTGTLTTNVMTCMYVVFDLKERECDTTSPMQAIEGDFYDVRDKMVKQRKPDFLRLVRCAALCNNAEFIGEEIDETANATETAMVKFAFGHVNSAYSTTVANYRKYHKKLHEIPFNSSNKWQISVHELMSNYTIDEEGKIGKSEGNEEEKSKVDDSNKKLALIQMKGAPERVLTFCDRHWMDGKSVELTEKNREEVMDLVMTLGSRGQRVLALAEVILDPQEYDLNIEEPIPEYFSEEVEAVDEDNCVVVELNDEKHKVPVSGKNEAGKEYPWEELQIKHIKDGINQTLNIPVASQRILFGNRGQILDDELLFSDLKCERGSVFHLRLGPYKFAGTKEENVNWPFRRNGEQGLVFIGRNFGPKIPNFGRRGKRKYGGNKALVKDEEYDAVVVPGWELQEELDKDPRSVAEFWNRTLIKNNVVFARTSPQQKLLIVSACQDRGGIVAVTGDGVNDSPALKKADIGIAMGKTGTEVAKEAADMILLDDNFASIVNGVEEGRLIFDNLKKAIAYILSSNIPELIPFLLTQMIGLPLPLTTVMILMIDLGTDIAPSIAMAYEEKESDIMHRPPRNAKKISWCSGDYLVLRTDKLVFWNPLAECTLTSWCWQRLDRDLVFEDIVTHDLRKYSYWLHCFEPDFAKDLDHYCYFMPDFGNTQIGNVPSDKLSFNSSHDFSDWLGNTRSFIKSSRKFLKSSKTSNFQNAAALTNAMNQKNWTAFQHAWNNGFYDDMSKHLFRTNLYPTRPCHKTDFFGEKFAYCDHSMTKSRTYPGRNSLFPMQAKDRNEALLQAQTAFFISVVTQQWANILVCKTRTRSLFEQGLGNGFMNYALLCETLLAGVLTYIPASNIVLATRPVRFVWWLAGLPFAMSIIAYDEIRKGIMRKHPNGWLVMANAW